MAVKIANISLPDFPLLLAPMEDVSDPPFRYVCKKHEPTLCTRDLFPVKLSVMLLKAGKLDFLNITEWRIADVLHRSSKSGKSGSDMLANFNSHKFLSIYDKELS